jgi:transcription initiation factor TFIIE subunit beta
MDPALLKERAKFMNRALAQPTVEKRKSKSSHDSDKAKKAKVSSSRPKEPKSSSAAFDYKTASGSSQMKFGILAKVVNFMKKRHQDNDTYPLSIDEILDETNQLDVGNKNKHWLITEALPKNPKILVS